MSAAWWRQTPPATGKRRVSLEIEYNGRMKECDRDAFWKTTFDALFHAKLLISDAPHGVIEGDLTQTRAKKLKTTIILEELD